MLGIYYLVIIALACFAGQGMINIGLAYLFLACFLLIGLIKNRLDLTALVNLKDKFEFFFILFLVYALISGLWSAAPTTPLLHVLGLYLVFVFVRLPMYYEPFSIQRSLNIIVATNFLFLLLTILLWKFHPHSIEACATNQPFRSCFYGLSHERNHFNAILTSAFILCIFYLFYSPKSWRLLFPLSCITADLIFIFLSGSRASIYSVLLLFLLCLFYSAPTQPQFPVRILKIGILLLVCILALIYFYMLGRSLIGGPSLHNYISYFHNQLTFSPNDFSRQTIWIQSIKVLLHKNWVTGVGLGNQIEILKLSITKHPFLTLHNSFVELFINTGLIGILLSLVFFYYYLKQLTEYFLKSKTFLSFFILASAISILLYCFVESYLFAQLLPFYFLFLFLYYYTART